MITRLLFQLHGLAIALIVGPLVAVTAAMLVSGRIDGREALAAILSVIPGALYVLWLYRQKWRIIAGQLGRLADPSRIAHSNNADIDPVQGVDDVLMPELRRLSDRLSLQDRVFDALPDPVLLTDQHRTVLAANPAACRLLGDHVQGRDITLAIRHPDVLLRIGESLETMAPTHVEWGLKGSVEQIFDVRITPLANIIGVPQKDDINAHFLVIVLHDITSLRRTEQMRADFVANASHELRTPLASLMGFIETLRGPAHDDPEAQNRFLKIMADQAGRMTRLVDELLTLSRIEIDEHQHPTGKVFLPPLLQEIVSGAELRAATRQISLALDCPADLPAVTGDRDQIIQMVQNLVDNALSYAATETTVTLRADIPPDHAAAFLKSTPMVAIAVIDQGPGIAREHLARLTERFYRVDPARSRAAGGTGLGLAIVKHIINRHRGRLTIDSRLGTGSTFTLYLPIA